MQIFGLGSIRIIALDSSGHPAHIVRMGVCVVAVPQARLMVRVDFDERYAGADHGDDRQREYYVAGALVN